MNEKLEALKPLLKAGEYEKAAEALKEYRTEFPDDWDGKLMEGIIAQLQGDEETFKRILDEAQITLDVHGKDAKKIKASPLWRKYHSSWKEIVKVTVIIGLAVVTALILFTYPNSSASVLMTGFIERMAIRLAYIIGRFTYLYY